MQDFWDKKYEGSEFVYGREPNEFLRNELKELVAGTILFPAEGEGRNAVFAAQKGWQVKAFDRSIIGQQKAIELAKARGVVIDYEVADVAHYRVEEKFDCIALIYAHFPKVLRRKYHRRLMGMLRKGGTLILEGFSKYQLGRTSGGPPDSGMLFSEQELVDDFRALTHLNIITQEVVLAEGSLHKGLASVIRLVGKKSG